MLDYNSVSHSGFDFASILKGMDDVFVKYNASPKPKQKPTSSSFQFYILLFAGALCFYFYSNDWYFSKQQLLDKTIAELKAKNTEISKLNRQIDMLNSEYKEAKKIVACLSNRPSTSKNKPKYPDCQERQMFSDPP